MSLRSPTRHCSFRRAQRRAAPWTAVALYRFAIATTRRLRLMKTWPAMQHDSNRPEIMPKVDADEDAAGRDDAAAAMRYVVGYEVAFISRGKLKGL